MKKAENKEKLINKTLSSFCKTNKIETLLPQITKLVTIALLRQDSIDVYNKLTYEYKSTGELALELDMGSNTVSSILNKLHKETSFILMKREGKLKSWAKA